MPDDVTAVKAVAALGSMFEGYVGIDRVAVQETIAVDAARRVLHTVTCQCAYPSDMHRWQVQWQMHAELCHPWGRCMTCKQFLSCSV